MANDSQRDKARAIFGKTFFENSKALPNPKNAAAALQKRANDRPIPTYKVGGVVKKQKPPQPTAAEREADRKRREEYAKMKVTKEQGESINRANRAAAIEGGRYKDGGKIGKYKQGDIVVSATKPTSDSGLNMQNLDYRLPRMDSGNFGGSSGGGGGRSTAIRMTPTSISQPSSPTAAMAGQGPPKGYGFKLTKKFKKGGEAMAGAKRAVKAEQDFTGLMKDAASRAAAKGTPVMKQGGATDEYTAKRVMSRIKAGNFKDGGRAELLRDRRMKDIEKDYKIALAKGKNADVADAKRAQRVADAADDYAKRTGADRTKTRAAEKAAESNLTKTRKYGAVKAVTTEAPEAKVMDSMSAMAAPKMDSSIGAKPAAAKAVVKKTVAKAPTRQAARQEAPAATSGKPAAPATTPRTAAPTRTAFSNIAAPALLARSPFGEATAARLKKQEADKAAQAARDKAAMENRYQGRGRIAVQAPRPIQAPKKVATASTAKPITAEERRKRDAAYLSTQLAKGGKVEKFAVGGVGKVRKGMMKGK